VLRYRYRDDGSAAVFYDVGIFWDAPGIKNHSPDLSLIFGVKQQKEWKTFHVRTEGVRPALIIEVTSPDTRVNDLKRALLPTEWVTLGHCSVGHLDKRIF
jgi:Uma2 family endonuclease